MFARVCSQHSLHPSGAASEGYQELCPGSVGALEPLHLLCEWVLWTHCGVRHNRDESLIEAVVVPW